MAAAPSSTRSSIRAIPDGDVGDVFEFKLSSVSPNFENGTQELPERIFSVGEDENGELYLIAGPDPRQPFNPNRPSLIIRLAPKIMFGDLNGDQSITGIDWTLFKAGQGSNFAGLSSLETYSLGDLDGDLDHDLDDFLLFRTAYDQANGAGAFEALLGVPEPSSIVMVVSMLLVGACRHRGKSYLQSSYLSFSRHSSPLKSTFSYKIMGHRNLNIAVFVVALCSIGLLPRIAVAQSVEDPDRSVASPNGKIVFRLLDRDPDCLRYQISFGNEPVIESSRIGIVIDGVNLDQGARVEKIEQYEINEQYPCLGVHSTATNHCRGAKFYLLHPDTHTRFVLEVRAFDDGVAFRHIVPGTGLRTPDAATEFTIPRGASFGTTICGATTRVSTRTSRLSRSIPASGLRRR